jgi:hypothetical protein
VCVAGDVYTICPLLRPSAEKHCVLVGCNKDDEPIFCLDADTGEVLQRIGPPELVWSIVTYQLSGGEPRFAVGTGTGHVRIYGGEDLREIYSVRLLQHGVTTLRVGVAPSVDSRK